MARRERILRQLPPVLRHRAFALYTVANLLRMLPMQMVAVAVGWQVYSIHQRPLDLGLVGLAEFLPLPLLALPAGQLADRVSRRFVLAIATALHLVVVALLLAVTAAGAAQLWPFLALAALGGVAAALGNPAGRALPPELVAAELLSSAMAVRSIGAQLGIVGGPALGGLLFAASPELVYAVAVALLGVALVATLALHREGGGYVPERGLAPGLETLLGGIRFLRRSRVVLGAILLDLFAVLFGGAVALLPAFAQTILHTGPIGLGVLRSAPAAGALVAGVAMARRPLERRAGPLLLVVVAVFGVSVVVFGLSRWFPLSLAALAVSGFADMISVNIRATTTALATPDELRGRVNAVEMVFISASNELGAFESGAAAALIGIVPAVVAGGVATVAIAALWWRFFPALSRLDRLEALRPEPVAA